jgi:hypothetical protein
MPQDDLKPGTIKNYNGEDYRYKGGGTKNKANWEKMPKQEAAPQPSSNPNMWEQSPEAKNMGMFEAFTRGMGLATGKDEGGKFHQSGNPLDLLHTPPPGLPSFGSTLENAFADTLNIREGAGLYRAGNKSAGMAMNVGSVLGLFGPDFIRGVGSGMKGGELTSAGKRQAAEAAASLAKKIRGSIADARVGETLVQPIREALETRFSKLHGALEGKYVQFDQQAKGLIQQIVRYNPDLTKHISDLFRETGRSITTAATESEKVRTASRAAGKVVPETLDVDRRAQELAKKMVDPAKDPQKYIQTEQKIKEKLLGKAKVMGEVGTSTKEVTKDVKHVARPYMEYKEANAVVRRLRDLQHEHPIAGKLADAIDGSIDRLAGFHGLGPERDNLKNMYKEFKDLEVAAATSVEKGFIRDLVRKTQAGRILLGPGEGKVQAKVEQAASKLLNKITGETKEQMLKDVGKWVEGAGAAAKQVPRYWKALHTAFTQDSSGGPV